MPALLGAFGRPLGLPLTKRLNRGEDIQSPGAAAAALRPEDAPPTGPTVGEIAAEFIKRYVQRERKQPREAEMTMDEAP